MRAKIYNKDKKRCYISEVYGVLNCGVDMYIIFRRVLYLYK